MPIHANRPATAALLVCALAAALASACSKPDKPVLKIDGQAVTASQWTVFLGNRGIPLAAPKAEIDEALKRLVRRCVSAKLAEKRGLLKGEAWEAEKREAEETALIQVFLEGKDGKSFSPTEEEVRAFMQERTEGRRLRRIVCETPEKAGEALKKIRSGTPFGAAAKAFSADRATAESGGEAGWARKPDLPPDLASAIFSAKAGDVLGPLQAGDAWLLIEVAEVRGATEEEFRERKPEIVEALRFQKLSAARDESAKALTEKEPVKVDEAVLAGDPSLEVKPGDEKKAAATVGKESVSLAEVKRYAEAFLRSSGGQAQDGPELRKKLAEELGLNRLLATAARKDGLDRRPRAKSLVWDAVEEVAARRFALDYLEKLDVPETTLQAFYQENREAFSIPAGLRIQMMGAPSPEILGRAIQAIEGGMSLEEVLGKFGPQGLQSSPEAGSWVPEPELAQMVSPKLAEALAKMPIGKWLGPIPAEGGVRAMRVMERRAGRTVSFSDVAGQVQAAYLQENGRKLVYDYLDGPGKAPFKLETFPENLAPEGAQKG